MRNDMSVITTQADVDRFLEDPQISHDEVLSAAMRGYAGALITYRDRLASTPTDVPPDVDVQIALNDCIDTLADFGEPTGVRREATEREKARATALLTQLLSDRPELLKQHTDVLGEAWASTHTTLTNWMIDGQEVTDAFILFKRVKAVHATHMRRQIQYEKRIRSDESLTTGLDDHGAVTAWGGDSDTETFDRVEFRNLLDQMRTALNGYPAAVIANDVPIDCWEKQYARAILDNGAAVADRVDFTQLHPLVMQVWRKGKPTTARSNTAAQAAKDIETMLRIAFSSVVEHADDLSLVGTRKRTETWRARTAEVNSLLEKSRDDAGMEKK
ncbi:hypothetical protein CA951_02725 [Rhodococcus sp. NCIMB 12038]|nr:hypothetical protein CA951_02725 [Rhodococcus sp. NCIMB 12038]